MDPRGGAEHGLAPETSAPDAGGGMLRSGHAFVGNAAVTLAGAAAGAVFTMGNEVLAARFLGVAGYGLYALALMLARGCAMIAPFGLPISVMHYLPVHLSRGKRGHALGTILGCIPPPLFVGLGFALALGLGGHWVAAHVLGQPGAGRFLVVLAFAIPLMAMTDLLGHVTRGFGRALPCVVIQNLAPQFCTMAVLIGLLLSNGPQIGAAYGQLGGLAVGVAVGIAFVVQLVRVRIGPARPVFEPRRLYGYALPVMLNIAAAVAIGWTDLFLLGLLSDAETVGTYRGCMQIVLVFDLLWNGFAAATAPLFTVLVAEGRRTPLQETYSAAVRLATMLAIPALLVIIVNGGDILGLLGPAFAAGAPALVVLACGQCVRVAFGAAAIVLIIGGRQRLEGCNMALAAGLNLMLNLLLIPAYGLFGAALATATSLIGLAILRCVQLRRVLALDTLDRTLLRVLFVSVPLALAIWAASLPLGLGPGSGPLPLVLRLAMMAVLIGGGLWRFCLNADDRAMLMRLVRRRGPDAAPAGAALDRDPTVEPVPKDA